MYKSKYIKSDNLSKIEHSFFNNTNIPKLCELDKAISENPLEKKDYTAALKKLANDKSPGSDGLTSDFYKFFWSDISDLLIDSYNYTFRFKELTQEQKIAIINLIPKKDKDLRFLKNWRPVSLLNTDYKILTKALAIRLQNVIRHLIHEDQVGYIKGRNEHKSGFITLIDFEKAFDSIEWPFLFKCLKNFNFGDNFISWIRILYTNIKSCVGNNGYYSDKFDVLRSVRQGCPISALLFILVAEILAINVRENDEIRGITYNNRSFQITQLADDTTLFLADLESVVISISLFQTFASVSGLTLNLDKSEIIPLGENVHKNIKLPQELKKLRYNNGAFKTLGIWCTNKKREKISLNFDEKIKKIEIVLNVWSMRALSLKGKVTILKSLIISQMTFLFSVLFVPEYILQKLDKLIFSFLWDGKTPKVKRETMINNINDGGLGMPDVYSVNSTSKISWIKRLTNERDCKWKILTLYMLNLNSTHLSHKIPETWISHCKTDFHKQLLQCWLF